MVVVTASRPTVLRPEACRLPNKPTLRSCGRLDNTAPLGVRRAVRAAAASTDTSASNAEHTATVSSPTETPLDEASRNGNSSPTGNHSSTAHNDKAVASATLAGADAAARDDGVSFVRPVGCTSSAHAPQLPFCLYFPAMDGQGFTAMEQFPTLGNAFDLFQMKLSVSNRSSYQRLVELSVDFLEEMLSDSPTERPVYLIGDSWGALLALGTALRCPELVQRVVLVSPATAVPDANWARLLDFAAPALALAGPLPGQLQRSLPLAFAPILGNPLRMMSNVVDVSDGLERLPSDATRVVSNVLGQLGALGEQLPPATLDWRLKLMRGAIRELEPQLRKVEQRVLVVVGGEDRLLPAAEEAERLKRRMQRTVVRVLPDAGHSLMQERGVGLLRIMEEEGFYVTERRFTSRPRGRRVGNNYGKPGPLELPTLRELERAFEQYAPIGTLTSPVFFSEADDGSIKQGLQNVNTDTERPILLIGNHQLFGLDMSFMIREFLVEKGRLMRGLTHPAIFLDAPEGSEGGAQSNMMRSQFTSFGSVPVGATAMYRLLQNGEMVLLFPGGAREAFKKRRENYELIWPKNAEFVRMAARTGAIIIPFAAVGNDDSLNYILDSEEVMNNPVVMKQLLGDNKEMEQFMRTVQGRRGVNAGAIEDYLVPPILAPGVPQRFYYLFRKPIVLEPEDAADREKCAAVYANVRAEVEGGLAYLVKKRQNDPYKDVIRRVVYEQLSKEQAPSFNP